MSSKKKDQSEAREHLANARGRARGAVRNSNQAVVPPGPQLSAGTAPDGWASRHRPQFDEIFSARDVSVLRHQSFCFSSFSECATAGWVSDLSGASGPSDSAFALRAVADRLDRPCVGALLYLDAPRAGGRMGAV